MQIELALAEVQEKARQAGSALLAVLCGALLVFSAWMVLLAALVTALSAQMPAWLAAGIVGLLVAFVGAMFIHRGLRDLSAERLKPQRTLDVLRHERDVVKETIS